MSKEELVEDIVSYYKRNKFFLERFEPKRDEYFFTKENHLEIIRQDIKNIESKKGFRFYIQDKEGENIIGVITIDNIIYGPFLSCYMGYKLDGEHLNKGLMTEAVLELVKFAFNQLGLHRIEANVMPSNQESLRVLEKSGFKLQGVSEKYLKINGIWEDHCHMVILNDNLE